MTQQYIREFGLVIDTGSETIDVSELRGRFNVKQTMLQTPNYADIVITNLKESTAQKIKKEGQSVTLKAGYRGASEQIFKGNLIQKRIGRENPVDTYAALLAQAGDLAYNAATVSKTLAQGSTYKDQVDVVLEAMKPFGITAGNIADLGSKKMPGARVLFGMARDVMRDIAFSTKTSWFIENDQLHVVKDNEPTAGDAFVLNSSTGLIGRPVQTFDGIIARCLLNPKLKPGVRVKIDQASIDEAAFSPSVSGGLSNELFPSLADDGFYKIEVADHQGDTRGNAWYTDIITSRADGKGVQSLSLANKGIALDAGQ